MSFGRRRNLGVKDAEPRDSSCLSTTRSLHVAVVRSGVAAHERGLCMEPSKQHVLCEQMRVRQICFAALSETRVRRRGTQCRIYAQRVIPMKEESRLAARTFAENDEMGLGRPRASE